jgi:hypothetical protein
MSADQERKRVRQFLKPEFFCPSNARLNEATEDPPIEETHNVHQEKDWEQRRGH